MLTRPQSARLLACVCVFFTLFLKAHVVSAQESNADYWAHEAHRLAPAAAGHIRAPSGPAAAMVAAAARRHGVPVHLALGVARVESGLRCAARNGHARGVMQVLPQTARSVGITGNLLDCATGAEAGVRYLKLALSRGGAGCSGLSLYNRGAWARPICTSYGRKVLARS